MVKHVILWKIKDEIEENKKEDIKNLKKRWTQVVSSCPSF